MDHRLRASLLAGIGALLLTVASCTLQMPGAPIWTVQAAVPFSERVYRMGELVTDSARKAERGWGMIVNPADGALLFETTDSLEYQQIGDRIRYEASDVGAYDNRIGLIHIEQPTPDADTINISEANPDLRAGFTGPVAPFNMTEAKDTMRFDVFRWVRVNRGFLRMTVTNNYPFEMRNLTVDLQNIADGVRLGRIIFPQPIASGATAVDSLDLAGALMYSDLLMTANSNSPGSANPVTITGAEKLSISVGVSPTDVDSANAEVAEQTFSNPDRLDIDNRNRIVEARIKNGAAFFNLQNTTPFRLNTDMVFENIKDSTGASIRKRIILDPLESSGITSIDLSNAIVTMPLNNQGLVVSNDVTVEDTRTTRYRGETYQTIAGHQGVQVQYWTNELQLSHFEGILDSITVDIPAQATAIEVPQGLDSIRFTRDTVFVFLDNETTMPMKGNFSIRAVNSRNGQSVNLPIPVDLLPGVNTMTIPDADQLISVLPDSIIIDGWAGLGRKFFPNQGVGVVDENDGFSGTFLVRSGLKFTIGTTRIITSPNEVEGGLDFPLKQVDLTVRLKNSIPLAGTVKLLMGNDTTMMDTVIQVDVPRGPLANRRAAAAETTYTVGLDAREIEIMKRKPLFTRQILMFQSNQGDTAWIFPEDSLAVQANATIFYTVNPNEEGN